MPKGMTMRVKPRLSHVLVAREIKRQLRDKDPKTLGETLISVGKYKPSNVKHNTAAIMANKGMQIALADEGISLQMADNVVKNIMLSPVVYEMVTPDNQLRAADYISRRLGGYAPEKLEVRKVVAKIVINKPQNDA